ncbi:MAG: hypothetical protein KDB25_08830 [Leucobacter sp.]|nr:hypothetical protein [Leucobacter sp.]
MSGVLAASLGGEPAHLHECSRAGCRAAAAHAIVWRNPKIHAADRRKTWLACDDHLDYLRGFLADRSFPIEVIPVEDLPR